MATHDYVLANQSGSSFRSDLNNALAAIVSSNSSATEPATPYAYQYWVDTSATPELIKQRNSTNDGWITLGEVNGQTLVSDGTDAKPGIAFAADVNSGLKRDAADQISLVTAGAKAITINSSGQVGINSDSPTVRLEVEGNVKVIDQDSQSSFIVETQVDNANDSDISIRKSRGGTGGPSQITAGDQLGTFRIRAYDGSSFTNAFAIISTSTTNTGNFAPNTVIQNNGLDRLTFRSDGNIQLYGSTWAGTSSPASGTPGYFIPNGGHYKFSRIIGPAGAAFTIYGTDGLARVMGDGDLQNTNNNYGAISDIKLKENIVDANSQWDDIKAIQIRNYNFKADTPYSSHTQIGVIAQELETVCPRLVKDTTDEDADGNDTGTVTKTVSYSVLYMKAVKALQEAMTRIEELETKVAALEAAN